MNNSCCFLGHRKINDTEDLRNLIYDTVEKLIREDNIDTFLFGSKSQFNSLCHEIVTNCKKKHPHIKRVYVRSQFPYINEDYENYLLESYEHTYFPAHLLNAGKASHVERNREMIDKSAICVFYYDPEYAPPRRKVARDVLSDYQPKSGTNVAYIYATKKKKVIINLAERK